MSVVTNIILSTSVDDNRGVSLLNKWLADEYPGYELTQVDGFINCGKAMEKDVYLAAINHLVLDEFLDKMRTAPWEDPEDVQLFICGEFDTTFSEYDFI